MKIYLDNSVVSAIGRDDTPTESDSILTLLKSSDTGTVELCTSEITAREIEKYKSDQKRFVETVYLLLKKVPYIERQKLLGMHSYIDRYTCINYPLIEDDPVWSKLRTLGLDETDAHHLMVAVKAGCAVFLTIDSDFIFRKRKIRTELNIDVMRPSDLINELPQ